MHSSFFASGHVFFVIILFFFSRYYTDVLSSCTSYYNIYIYYFIIIIIIIPQKCTWKILRSVRFEHFLCISWELTEVPEERLMGHSGERTSPCIEYSLDSLISLEYLLRWEKKHKTEKHIYILAGKLYWQVCKIWISAKQQHIIRRS